MRLVYLSVGLSLLYLSPALADKPERHIELRGPKDWKLAFETAGSKSDLPAKPFPIQIAIHREMDLRGKLIRAARDADAAVYLRLEAKRWPPTADTVPSIMLTKDELEAAASGKHVVKALVLRGQSDEETAKPGFQTLSSIEDGATAESIAAATLYASSIVIHVSKNPPDSRSSFLPAFGDENDQTQMMFSGPKGTIIRWSVTAPGKFDSAPLVAPGRYNFPRGAVYRLKISQMPGHTDVELFPTLEVAPALPRSADYLTNNAIPVGLTEEEIAAVLDGKPLVKVVYLPGKADTPNALRGIETLVAVGPEIETDPVVDADRRGTILAILRVDGEAAMSP